MTTDAWKLDSEYQDGIIEEVHKEGDSYVVTVNGWSLGWPCDFEPQVGDTARYFGRGLGYEVRGVVCFPKQGGRPLVVRYDTPAKYDAKCKTRSEAYEKERAARVQQPSVEAFGRVFDSEMGEISGFGGGYEECCRKMALAGMKWFDDNQASDPKFQGFKGVFGVITEDNDDAKALTKAILDAADGEATGAMHQACVSHALAYKRLGWDGYRAEMVKPAQDKA